MKIGFSANINEQREAVHTPENGQSVSTGKKSLVRVYFPSKSFSCTYFNDGLELHKGDTVFVEGKLEGLRGIVTEITFTYKIKLFDYKRVIAKADTSVRGEVFFGDTYVIAFDNETLSYEKCRGWFLPPVDEETVISEDDEYGFPLEQLNSIKISCDEAEKGRDLFFSCSVALLCIEGDRGKAIITDRAVHEVEFRFENGMISNLVCDCYSCSHCEHEFAALLQLQKLLKDIEKNFPKYTGKDFIAIDRSEFFSIAVSGKDGGSARFDV